MHQEHHEEEQGFSFKSIFIPLTNLKAIHWIVIIGIVVYFNSLFNGFIWDDFQQIVNNPLAYSLNNFFSFFAGGTYYGANGQLIGHFYRPVMMFFFALLGTLFGPAPFYFHLFSLLIHLSNTVMIFFLLKKFISKQLALFFSLIFLVHPINIEAVGYISGYNDLLFVFFGLLALHALSLKKKVLRITLVCFLLLLSALSKETGIIFIFITLLYSLFFTSNNKKITFSLVFIPLGVYIFMRFMMAHIGIYSVEKSWILVFQTIPKIFSSYLFTFLFPKDLAVSQNWIVTNFSFQDFILPLLIDLTFCVICFFLGKKIYSQNKQSFRPFLFFVFWFFISMGLLLQIIKLDMTVAERWFYFPMIGLLGMIGLSIETIHFSPSVKKVSLGIFVIILIALSWRTIVRNTNWHDEITLFEHDIPVLQKQHSLFVGTLQNDLAQDLLAAKRYDEAEKYALDSLQYQPNANRYNTLGEIYQTKGENAKAIYWYTKAINTSHVSLAYENLSTLLLVNSDFHEAQKIIQEGISHDQKSYKLWLNAAYVDYFLGNKKDALAAAKEAYLLNNNEHTSIIYNQLLQNQQVKLLYTL